MINIKHKITYRLKGFADTQIDKNMSFGTKLIFWESLNFEINKRIWMPFRQQIWRSMFRRVNSLKEYE